MVFDSGKRNLKLHPLIEHYEFYIEDEDEEIDTQNLFIKEKDPFVGSTNNSDNTPLKEE